MLAWLELGLNPVVPAGRTNFVLQSVLTLLGGWQAIRPGAALHSRIGRRL